jgi:hypothetical protein
MSPTVLRERAYRVKIYLNDHAPAHVHISKAEKDARVQLEPVLILHTYGFNTRELAEIEELVRANQTKLLAKWDEIHPER